MSYLFADSFKFYNVIGDMTSAGYWDGFVGGIPTIVNGRFSGDQAIQWPANTGPLFKSSGSNDATHHIVVTFLQHQAGQTGTSPGFYVSLSDGTTAQCSIVFRSDGAILLTSGGPTGTTLATWNAAVTALETWFSFEFEVTINSSTGAVTGRRNGNTSNDWAATGLNTRGGTTNNYANEIRVGNTSSGVNYHQTGMIFWFNTTGAAPNTWVGDIRPYQQMPTSDVTKAFSSNTITIYGISTSYNTTITMTSGTASYTAITAPINGTVGSLLVGLNAGATGHINAAIFNSTAAGLPGTVLATASAAITNPVAGLNTFTFSSPPTVTQGTLYFIAFDQDVSVTYISTTSVNNRTSTTAYASFPAANPVTSISGSQLQSAMVITPTTNYDHVNEQQEDGTTSYVYSSTVSTTDWYGIAALPSTATGVIAVTTRGFMEKSDAGTRSAAVQLRSSSTVETAPTLVLGSSFLWNSRTDTVDPNTSAAWTTSGVNAINIGPTVIA